MRLIGKDYVPWHEFEFAMISAGMNERDFIAEAKLGMYSLREWRRHGAAPYWAKRLADALAREKLVPVVTQQTDDDHDRVIAAMTEDEMNEYGLGTKQEMEAVFERVRARLANANGLIG